MSDISLPGDRAATQATVVEQSRAVAEVAAAVRVAQDFPRDIARAVEQIRQSCSQKSLANRAFYSLPRAGGRVEGSTVHLAREMARCFGNIEYGIRETRRDDAAGISEVLAWAWDVETNVRQSRGFVIPHARMAGGRRQALTDLSEIANNNNSVAARALRECILTLLPVWFRDEAESIAAETLNAVADGETVEQRITAAIEYFAREFSVTLPQMETRLGMPRSKWTPAELATLNVIASEFGRGEKAVEDEFPEKPIEIPAVAGGDE